MSQPRRSRLYLAVGCGAALGSLLRLLSGAAFQAGLGLDSLWSTGFVNVVGSFAITLFAKLTEPAGRFPTPVGGRLFVMSGICGGFTTFSALSLETVEFWLEGDRGSAAVYMAAVIVLSLAAAWSGHAIAVNLNRRIGR
jgi:fluoride exporter